MSMGIRCVSIEVLALIQWLVPNDSNSFCPRGLDRGRYNREGFNIEFGFRAGWDIDGYDQDGLEVNGNNPSLRPN